MQVTRGAVCWHGMLPPCYPSAPQKHLFPSLLQALLHALGALSGPHRSQNGDQKVDFEGCILQICWFRSPQTPQDAEARCLWPSLCIALGCCLLASCLWQTSFLWYPNGGEEYLLSCGVKMNPAPPVSFTEACHGWDTLDRERWPESSKIGRAGLEVLV